MLLKYIRSKGHRRSPAIPFTNANILYTNPFSPRKRHFYRKSPLALLLRNMHVQHHVCFKNVCLVTSARQKRTSMSTKKLAMHAFWKTLIPVISNAFENLHESTKAISQKHIVVADPLPIVVPLVKGK